jgi:uncharacterized protein (DUF2249 family)
MILIDARGWEPPRPFEATMEALSELKPGEKLRLIVDREPLPLYRTLNRNGYAFFATVQPDGSFEIDIGRPQVP